MMISWSNVFRMRNKLTHSSPIVTFNSETLLQSSMCYISFSSRYTMRLLHNFTRQVKSGGSLAGLPTREKRKQEREKEREKKEEEEEICLHSNCPRATLV